MGLSPSISGSVKTRVLLSGSASIFTSRENFGVMSRLYAVATTFILANGW